MAWIEVLENGRQWDQSRDVPRFRQAFVKLAETREQWPQPKHFLEALPRVEQAAVTHATQEATPEQAAAALARIRAILGTPLPVHRAVKPRDTVGPSLEEVEADLRRHYDGKAAAAGPDA